MGQATAWASPTGSIKRGQASGGDSAQRGRTRLADGPQPVKGAKNRDNAIKFIDFPDGRSGHAGLALVAANCLRHGEPDLPRERIMKAGDKLNAPGLRSTRRHG